MARQTLASVLCRVMRSVIVSVLLLWAVVVVAQEQEVDIQGPPAASELTIAELSEKVSKELASLRTFESYPMPESFERRRTLEIRRDEKTIQAYLDAGVEYVIIGTRAANEPEFINEIAGEFGKNLIIGLDAKDGIVAVDGWAKLTEHNVIDLAKRFENDGVQAIIYTDIARDGMMQGCNIEATVELARQSPIPIIASGGIARLDDIIDLHSATKEKVGANIVGAITGRAIYEGKLDLRTAQEYCDSEAS